MVVLNYTFNDVSRSSYGSTGFLARNSERPSSS
jgi:hypothetical protein